MKPALIGFFFVLAAATSAEAQRTYVFGGASYERVTEDDGAFGDADVITVGIDRWLSNHTYVQLGVSRLLIARDFRQDVAFYEPGSTSSRAFTFVPLIIQRRASATFLTGSIGRTFGSAFVQPFIAGEIGVMRYDGLKTSVADPRAIPAGLEARQPLERRTPGLSARVVGGTTGVNMRIGSRWFARGFAGLRVADVGNFGPKYMLRYGVQAGIGW